MPVQSDAAFPDGVDGARCGDVARGIAVDEQQIGAQPGRDAAAVFEAERGARERRWRR